MRRSFAALIVLAMLAACRADDGSSASSTAARPTLARTASPPTGSGSATTGTPASGPGAAFVPAPDARLPAGARELAAALERATRAVRRSVDAWIRHGNPARWPPPGDLVLRSLYQQRIYRVLAQRPSLAAAVLERLSSSVRREAAAIVRATADIFTQANPVPPSYAIRTRNPEPADVLLGYYREAERRFGVGRYLLAAVNYVETKFGRVVSDSSAGAQGPMQFLSATWQAYGLGGDVHDAHDAILGAANYLHANGAPANVREALDHYNPVPEYVEAVATYANAIRRDPHLFYAMYCWQVYVLTTKGDRRVTGPQP